jgi:hypothetical protein
MLDIDLIPDVTGRNCGIPSKRYDGNFRNVNISGTLTGTGVQISSIINAIPDTDSLSISSDTGNGQVRERLRVGNDAGADYVPFEIRNVVPQFGSSDAGQGGAIESQFYSAIGDNPFDFLVFYQRGQADNGLPALRVTTDGEIINHGNGYAPWSFRSFNANDANPLFGLKPTGEHVWGPGGATAPDAGLKRISPALLGITNGAGADGALQMRTLTLTAPNGTSPMAVASATLVANLNSELLNGKNWGAPDVIGDVAPNDANFDALAATTLGLSVPDGTTPITTLSKTPVDNLTVKRVLDVEFAGIILKDSSAYKSKRVSTGSIASGARTSVAVNWDTAFASANYTISAEIFDALNPGTAGMTVERIVAQAADHVTLQVFNNGAEARTGTIHCLAFREA